MSLFNELTLENLVQSINLTHLELSQKWVIKNECTCLNLKNKRIKHVVDIDGMLIDISFLSLIDDYHTEINMLTAYTEYEFEYAEYDVRTRVKQKDSIVNKLVHYRRKPDESGDIPINKCLNDIFGIRVIFSELDHNAENFQSCLADLVERYNLKMVAKDREGYVATHLYFKNQNNKHLPWELQIWSSEHVISNEKAHKEHKSKRNYTTWPQVYLNKTEPERSVKG